MSEKLATIIVTIRPEDGGEEFTQTSSVLSSQDVWAEVARVAAHAVDGYVQNHTQDKLLRAILRSNDRSVRLDPTHRISIGDS